MSSGSEGRGAAASAPPSLAIFASGRGSNARAILDRFAGQPDLQVALVLTNKPGAGVLDIAREHGVPTHVTNREEFRSPRSVLPVLERHRIGFVALAGFLWLLPEVLVRAYPGAIVNIHPALLPKYGGKGMYGMHVHRAVHEAGDPASGITIHWVDELYDHGEPVFQARVELHPGDTPEDIAKRVLKLEHAHYPRVLADLLRARAASPPMSENPPL